MKSVFFVLAISFALKAHAQEPYLSPQPKVQKLTNDQLKKFHEKWRRDTIPNFADRLSLGFPKSPQGKLLFVQDNGTKVYALPKDYMPCLVPDLSQFNMPNTLNGKQITGMPPGSSQQQKLIPKQQSLKNGN